MIDSNFKNKLLDDFRGCAVIIRGGKEQLKISAGYADLPNKRINNFETKFATASAGKVFVAVGILQLIEKRKLKFDDVIGELLDIDLKQIDPLVTVRQLLTHTSGVPDYFNESVRQDYDELWKDFPNYKVRHNSDLLPLFIDKSMMYPRGEKFKYNNTGYVILAMIIEKITGLEFDQYLQKNVFDVCGMINTGYYELDRLPANCAFNYIYDKSKNQYYTNIFCVDAKGTGAGGAFTTIYDIISFWNNLLSYKLISGEMTKQMLSLQSGDNDGYGFGVWVKEDNGVYFPHFDGCAPGVSFFSEYNPKLNIISVLISNYCDNVWDKMNEIRKYLYN